MQTFHFFITFEILKKTLMKIISYNVNGIRAAITKGFIEWLQQANPDVICLQEIKATEEQIPVGSIYQRKLF
jgi:exodeoxyribonuclease III